MVVDMPTRHMDMAILLLKTTTILVLQTTTILVPKSTISLVANTTRALIEAAMEMETTERLSVLQIHLMLKKTGGSVAETGKTLEKAEVKAMKGRVSRGKAERVRSVQADSLKVAAEIWYDPGAVAGIAPRAPVAPPRSRSVAAEKRLASTALPNRENLERYLLRLHHSGV